MPTATKQKKFSRITLGKKREITIPAKTIKRMGIMPGAKLELRESKEGILLTPAKRKVPRDQKWFYTPRRQKMMQEAYEDVKKGRLRGPFDNVEEFLKDLRS